MHLFRITLRLEYFDFYLWTLRNVCVDLYSVLATVVEPIYFCLAASGQMKMPLCLKRSEMTSLFSRRHVQCLEKVCTFDILLHFKK